MIEFVARRLKQHNSYVANKIGKEELVRILSLANVLHSENSQVIADDWIKKYSLIPDLFDVSTVNSNLCSDIPSESDMGKVYSRLIIDTLTPDENHAQAIIKVYNNPICLKIDDYNCSAYFEPSYVIAKAFHTGCF